MKFKIGILIILSIICIAFIYLSTNIFFVKKDIELTVEDREISNYVLTNDDKIMLINRLGGNDIFAEYENCIDSYADISISTDKKDSKAWGEITLFFDMDTDEKLKKILQSSGIKLSNDNRTYAVWDDEGSIFIEKDYINNEKIKLVFSFHLPYRFTEKQSYNEYVNFFLDLI